MALCNKKSNSKNEVKGRNLLEIDMNKQYSKANYINPLLEPIPLKRKFKNLRV